MTVSTNFSQNFLKAYEKLYSLHPQQKEDLFHLRYLHVDWFFPNHLHNTLKNSLEIRKRFYPDANIEVILYGALFHDAGLVYKRDTPNPVGHENRSVEFATSALSELEYDDDFIARTCECIRATEPEYESILPEALVVKNADAYSHMMSMHFFAKANFAKDIYSYVPWFAKKLNSSFQKITIPDLKQELQPLYDAYQKMIANYHTNESEKDGFTTLLLSDL